MSKKLIARTAKLLSENRRYKNDTGVSIAYEHQPKDPNERKHGILFAVVEIIGPTSSSEEIAELVIDTLHNEFYKDIDKEPLESFENALAKVNEELAEITEQGKIHWLGKLSGIIMVLSEKTVHLSQAGKAEAILYRNKKGNIISEGLAGDAINPLRTFINIASGEVDEGDRIGIFSPGVFYHLSPEELSKYVNDFHPSVAINHLANILEENNGTRRSSAIIVEMITPEALASDTIQSETEDDEVWITDSKRGIEAVTGAANPIALKIAKKSVGMLSLAVTFFMEGLLPFLSAQAGKVKNALSGNKSDQGHIFVETKEAFSTDRSESIDFEDIQTFEANKENEEIKPIASENPARESLVFSTLKNFRTPNANKAKNYIPKNYKVMAIALAAVLLVFSTTISINKKRVENGKKEAQQTLEEAGNKYRESENFIILEDNEKAVLSLNAAKELAENVKKTKYLTAEADELLSKISAKINEAMGIKTVNDAPLSDLASVSAKTAFGLTAVGEDLFTVDKDNGNILKISAGSGEASVVLSDSDIDGNIVSLTSIEDSGFLAILTDKPAVYHFDTKTNDFSKADISGDIWEKGIDIAGFSTNIYIASREAKNIYKHIKTTGGYSKKVSYLKDPSSIDLSDLVSIAVDKNLYALKGSGEILKFTSGTKKDFIITGLPETIREPKKIFTSAEVKGIYIVNGNKVVRINENNEFVNQYGSDNFTDIAGIYADANNLYILSGNKIYKVKL